MYQEEAMLQLLRECRLCPRNCGVDRLSGQAGYCGCDARLQLARAALHMWEEPCISGEEGSGTVFFSGCSLGCVFCQNQEIAQAKAGRYVPPERLVEIFFELADQGANNINLVTAGHYVPQVALALQQAKAEGLRLLKEAGADEAVLKLKGLEAFEKVADGQATTILLPADLQGIASVGATLAESVKCVKEAPVAEPKSIMECGEEEDVPCDGSDWV